MFQQVLSNSAIAQNLTDIFNIAASCCFLLCKCLCSRIVKNENHDMSVCSSSDPDEHKLLLNLVFVVGTVTASQDDKRFDSMTKSIWSLHDHPFLWALRFYPSANWFL